MKILLFSIQLESTANRPIDVSTTVSVRESPTISVGSVEKSGKFYFIELPIHLCALAFWHPSIGFVVFVYCKFAIRNYKAF